MQPIKRLLKNKKGIDTILAALLMVVIVVVASVMVYAWSTGLLGALMGGGSSNVGKEALSLENTSFASSTNATLFIRNIGTASVSFVTYYVKDANGNQYSKTNWAGLAAITNKPVNALISAPIDINSATCGCTPPTTTFTFTPGNSYTVVIITSRNNQFSFSIVR